MSNSPAGVQIYLVTTFIFTLGQSAALRNETIRQAIGLPSLNSSTPEPVFATKFMKFTKQNPEQSRSDDLGKGVLKPSLLHTASQGSSRTSTIAVDDTSKDVSVIRNNPPLTGRPSTSASNFSSISEEAMEAANRGDKNNFAFFRRIPKAAVVLDEDVKKDVPLSRKKLIKGKRKT